ncbi:MAG: glycosyltransferase, partial [Lachnospiraceae bacterium]|nr:glycosyltransferase [Lachnospiraceae bacterium]
MQVVTILGVVMLVIALILTIETLYMKISGNAARGFTTVIIFQCFTSSIIMMSLGIIGYYISKIYEEVKGRPRYIISQTTDKE